MNDRDHGSWVVVVSYLALFTFMALLLIVSPVVLIIVGGTLITFVIFGVLVMALSNLQDTGRRR